MKSAALPQLPSVRARELEKRAIASQKHNNNNDGDGESARQAEKTALRSISKEEQQSCSEKIDLQLTAPSKMPSHVDDEKTEQLATLRQKEGKVFGGLPPLELNIACNVIHHHISTTSSFLNSLIADANAANEGIDHKLTVLETHMSLLESKIASVPDLFPES